MAVRNINYVVLTAVVAIVFLLSTLHPKTRDAIGMTSNSSPPANITPMTPGPNTIPNTDSGSSGSAGSATAPLGTQREPEDSLMHSKRPSFYDIAKKHGTDKVAGHNYHFMYQKYLEPIRDRKLKMLEIGLGCDIIWGPGKSYHTWLEYLPNVELYYLEYDAACAEKWRADTTGATIFSGDQADPAVLQNIITKTGGNFDIIVDDGGHSMEQQMVSLTNLFPSLVPSGIYFCEDLATSYMPAFGGGEGKMTMMKMIQELLHDLNHELEFGPKAKYPVGEMMRSIECGEEICAFFREGEFVGN